MTYTMKIVREKRNLDRTHLFYKKIFESVVDTSNPVYSREEWALRMVNDSELMLYVEDSKEVIAIVFARRQGEDGMILGPVAVHQDYRGLGLAKKMIHQIETNGKKKGITSVSLGAVEIANDFYSKLGYKGSFLVQSESYDVNQLLALNTGYDIEFTNIYDQKVNQVCYKMNQPDKELEKRYKKLLPNSFTMMMYKKDIS